MAQRGLYAIYHANPRAVKLQGRVEWSRHIRHTYRNAHGKERGVQRASLRAAMRCHVTGGGGIWAPVVLQNHSSRGSQPCSQLVKISRAFFTLNAHPSPSLKKAVACGLPALERRQWDGGDAPDSVPKTRRPETSQASEAC
jgi:hypothetical protein